MRKFALVSFAALFLTGGPAIAQQEAGQQPAVASPDVTAADFAEREKLALQFHDIRSIRTMIDTTIEQVAKTIPEADREDFARYIQLKMDYDRIEADSVKAMATLYTAGELKAMVAYYGSPEGRSAEAKSDAYAAKISPEISKIIDSAIMDARFGQSSPPAAKP